VSVVARQTARSSCPNSSTAISGISIRSAVQAGLSANAIAVPTTPRGARAHRGSREMLPTRAEVSTLLAVRAAYLHHASLAGYQRPALMSASRAHVTAGQARSRYLPGRRRSARSAGGRRQSRDTVYTAGRQFSHQVGRVLDRGRGERSVLPRIWVTLAFSTDRPPRCRSRSSRTQVHTAGGSTSGVLAVG
jgi:hypothetical protein